MRWWWMNPSPPTASCADPDAFPTPTTRGPMTASPDTQTAQATRFGALIIGDEILSGKRQDKHFAKVAELLGARGLQLSWVQYLGDDRARLTETLKRSFASGEAV